MAWNTHALNPERIYTRMSCWSLYKFGTEKIKMILLVLDLRSEIVILSLPKRKTFHERPSPYCMYCYRKLTISSKICKIVSCRIFWRRRSDYKIALNLTNAVPSVVGFPQFDFLFPKSLGGNGIASQAIHVVKLVSE